MPKPTAIPPQDPAAVAALKNLKDRVQSGIQKYRGSRPDVRAQRLPHTDDFARLARRICGVSIGLVLGGGGARGISHLVSHASLSLTECHLNLAREFCAHWKKMAYLSIISEVSLSILVRRSTTSAISRYQYRRPHRRSIRQGG